MLKKNLFKKPQNELEGYAVQDKTASSNLSDDLALICPNCKTELSLAELGDYFYVCKKCAYHLRVNARTRIAKILDENSFYEMDSELDSKNLLEFPEYEKKLKNAQLESSETEGVITGTGSIYGAKCAVFVMEPYFMMGSMGSVVGEKITLVSLSMQRISICR
jgi:acetyl-CoA carboxylase carboxyl transferase subunit beta